MFSIDDPSEKEMEEIIEKVANRIVQHGMEATAIVLLESSKLVSHIRTQLGQMYLTYPPVTQTSPWVVNR